MNVATGSFYDVQSAEGAINALKGANYPIDHIGVVVHDHQKGTMIARDLRRRYMTEAPPRDTVISDTVVYDRLPDGFTDLIHRSELPDDAINWYRQHLDQGKVLVTVDVGDRMTDADRIMMDHGGMLYRHGEMRREERMTTTEMRAPTETPRMGEVHMPVIDEEVLVEKARHQVGQVEVTSETTAHTVEVPTTITHEEIRVERRKLDHAMTPAEYQGSTTEKGVIRMPIVEEELRVTKTPVIREELVVTRLPVTEQETLRETVMHTEPHVETTGEVEVHEERPGKERPAA